MKYETKCNWRFCEESSMKAYYHGTKYPHGEYPVSMAVLDGVVIQLPDWSSHESLVPYADVYIQTSLF